MDYSICIRTLGFSSDKYSRLLKSISQLNIKPREIIIVLPEGYAEPEEKIEGQRIVYCKKGMLMQRIVGYEEACSEYVLLLDDDVEFESKLIEKLSKPLVLGEAEISFPIYEELLPQKGIRSMIAAFTLAAVPSVSKRAKFLSILPSGGYRYNRNYDSELDFCYSETGPGMCVFAKTQVLKGIALRDELWVEKCGYALRDDAVLIYKAFNCGYKSVAISKINITHLDGGGKSENRNLKAAYANTLNHIIFWHRLVFKNKKNVFAKIVSVLFFIHWNISTFLYISTKGIVGRDKEFFVASVKGIKNGYKEILNN